MRKESVRDWSIVVLCAAIYLALVALIYPKFASIGTDGVSYALMAKSLAEGSGLAVFGHPHVFFSPLSSFAIVPFFWLLGDIDLASHITLVVLGIISIPIIYFTTRMVAGWQAAALAALFLSVNANWVWRTLKPTAQPLATLLSIALLFFLLRYATKPKDGLTPVMWGFGIGALLAALYLTRPEYIFLLLPVTLFLGWIHHGELSIRKNAASICALWIGFILCVSPYIIFLHDQLGEWTISGRTSEEYLMTVDPNVLGSQLLQPKQLEQNSLMLLAKSFTSFNFIKDYAGNLLAVEHNLFRSFGIVGLLFWGWGLRQLITSRLYRELAVFVVVGSTLFALAARHTGENGYIVPHLPAFIVVIAIGCEIFIRELWSLFGARRNVSIALSAVVIVLTCGYFALTLFQNYFFQPPGYRPIEYQSLGTWFQHNIEGHEPQLIAARKPEIAFYAGALWEEISEKEDVGRLLSRLREKGIEYLAIDTRSLGEHAGRFNAALALEQDQVILLHTEEYYGKTISLYRLAP